ncbi:hypothetical protein NKH85_24520 [Mesorhizobium sp. M0924]|uniref:hypothetical protein n=1 Tax=unclassified Mesorhizobium TaxID=325217 RepID=UPI0033358AED
MSKLFSCHHKKGIVVEGDIQLQLHPMPCKNQNWLYDQARAFREKKAKHEPGCAVSALAARQSFGVVR